MTTATKTRKPRKSSRKARGPKRDIQQEVTDKIVAALEAGTVPWVKPWSAKPLASDADCNAVTGTRYNGCNLIILWMAREANGWQSNRWISFDKCKALGGSVKGQKGTQVVLWKPTNKKRNPVTGEMEKGRGLYVTSFTVFNLDQCADLPADFVAGKVEPIEDKTEHERHATAEAFINATEATIAHGGNRAFYQPATDAIRVPEMRDFKSGGDYYSTVFHELAHWTGIESRCDRKFGARFGDQAYAAEELVAEMSAAFMCAEMGIDGKLQHTEYLASWIKVLKADSKAIFTAASKAKQAVKFLNECGEDAAEEVAAKAA